MNHRATAAVLAAAVAAAISGCAGITHGTITSKEYVPERHWIYEQPVYSERCTTSGSGSRTSTSCTSYISTYVPIPETDPECWKLHLKHNSDTGSVCVSQASWETAKVGGTW